MSERITKITDLVRKHLEEHEDQESLEILQQHMANEMAHLQQKLKSPIGTATTHLTTAYLRYLEKENAKMVKAREMYLSALSWLRSTAEACGEVDTINRIDQIRKGLGVEVP